MKKTMLLASLATLFICLFSATAFAANWKLVDSDEKMSYYIDMETKGKNPVSGWVKVAFEDKAAREAQAKEFKTAVSEIDWSDFYYMCDKMEYKRDSEGLKVQRLCTVFYDSKDNMIFVNNFPSPWEKVEQGTIGDVIYKALESE